MNDPIVGEKEQEETVAGGKKSSTIDREATSA